MTLLIVYLLLALGVSFICSILESVILATPASFIETKKQQHKKNASALSRIKSNIDRPLAAILTLNTVAHTVGAAGVGAQAAKLFGEVYFGIISAILTLLILVFSEIIPKVIGASYWRSLALPLTPMLQIIIFLFYPFVIMSEFLSKAITRNRKEQTISRDEMIAMAAIGEHEGILQKEEMNIISNLMKIKDLKAEDIMTPRTVMVSFPEDFSLDEFFKNEMVKNFSRFPIYKEDKDDITGYVLKSDILEHLAADKEDATLKKFSRNFIRFYEGSKVIQLYQRMLAEKEHISLILDEYGGIAGIVSMEDIIETLIGVEIMDEKDANADLQKLAREMWEKRAANLKIIPDK